MKLNIVSAAAQDLVDGYSFYEAQETGLGKYFLDSLFADIDSLIIYAGIHELHFRYYYRLLSKTFPFAIYYKLIKHEVVVYAVLDCRRDPAWIRRKLNVI